MNGSSIYSRPLGIAELVRQHGDQWRYAGMVFSDRIHDERLMSAYISADPSLSSDARDFMKMCFFTKRIYSVPINDVRGRA